MLDTVRLRENYTIINEEVRATVRLRLVISDEANRMTVNRCNRYNINSNVNRNFNTNHSAGKRDRCFYIDGTS